MEVADVQSRRLENVTSTDFQGANCMDPTGLDRFPKTHHVASTDVSVLTPVQNRRNTTPFCCFSWGIEREKATRGSCTFLFKVFDSISVKKRLVLTSA